MSEIGLEYGIFLIYAGKYMSVDMDIGMDVVSWIERIACRP